MGLTKARALIKRNPLPWWKVLVLGGEGGRVRVSELILYWIRTRQLPCAAVF